MPSLREDRRARTAAAIAAAALDLFEAKGYAAVTVAEIAAAAEVGERTVYRYFADKEDVLFADDMQWREDLRSAIQEQDDAAPLAAVLRRASETVARSLEDRREEVHRRDGVIAKAPALSARERAKRAAWEGAIGHGLRDRGVHPSEASLLSRLAVSAFDEAMARWLDADRTPRTLVSALDEVYEEMAGLFADRHPAG